ncbi:hypothetical protein TraAM80_10436 [Trypanosoma rangeli]|uniref:Uncharacterized protein n=1 Tax=Trypanosoma rangeli TaxID=5698 RepID=A0A422MP90_TRYRA|nr:uncharacterized protein TraAM80_10436 [Trypanosoma rangeli]RNE95038.1 hypothetical protein TraAM80_10436 [Trypanosoma rangeli]|eukprot:RNE95038.1 hypothetical protein TraAM80_10436 [Trypanosoma rangeli]
MIAFVLLGTFGAACVAGIVFITWRICVRRAGNFSLRGCFQNLMAACEQRVRSAAASNASSVRPKTPGTSTRMSPRLSSPSSGSEGTQRPHYRLEAPLEPKVQLRSSVSVSVVSPCGVELADGGLVPGEVRACSHA